MRLKNLKSTSHLESKFNDKQSEVIIRLNGRESKEDYLRKEGP